MKIKQIFHYISYLQFPLAVLALYYALKPMIFQGQTDLEDLNTMLVFMGLAVSFSTLQDTTKTQNKISRKVWESPKKGKIALIYFGLLAIFLISYGLYGFLNNNNEKLSEISFGILVLGIGVIGMLKAAIESFENHRKDKNDHSNT